MAFAIVAQGWLRMGTLGVPAFLCIAVVPITWWAGPMPGLFATGLGIVATWYVFLPPAWSFQLAPWNLAKLGLDTLLLALIWVAASVSQRD
jgi:K+-sensing histidine kinase KdpD